MRKFGFPSSTMQSKSDKRDFFPFHFPKVKEHFSLSFVFFTRLKNWQKAVVRCGEKNEEFLIFLGTWNIYKPHHKTYLLQNSFGLFSSAHAFDSRSAQIFVEHPDKKKKELLLTVYLAKWKNWIKLSQKSVKIVVNSEKYSQSIWSEKVNTQKKLSRVVFWCKFDFNG